MISVICGIIYKSDQVFVARRKPRKSMGGFWEFPGGKLEDGESEEECLQRELFEELGMQVEVGSFFNENIHDYGLFRIKLTAYKCEFVEATMKLVDHDQYKWVLPEELLSFELAPADIPIAERVVEITT